MSFHRTKSHIQEKDPCERSIREHPAPPGHTLSAKHTNTTSLWKTWTLELTHSHYSNSDIYSSSWIGKRHVDIMHATNKGRHQTLLFVQYEPSEKKKVLRRFFSKLKFLWKNEWIFAEQYARKNTSNIFARSGDMSFSVAPRLCDIHCPDFKNRLAGLRPFSRSSCINVLRTPTGIDLALTEKLPGAVQKLKQSHTKSKASAVVNLFYIHHWPWYHKTTHFRMWLIFLNHSVSWSVNANFVNQGPVIDQHTWKTSSRTTFVLTEHFLQNLQIVVTYKKLWCCSDICEHIAKWRTSGNQQTTCGSTRWKCRAKVQKEKGWEEKRDLICLQRHNHSEVKLAMASSRKFLGGGGGCCSWLSYSRFFA